MSKPSLFEQLDRAIAEMAAGRDIVPLSLPSLCDLPDPAFKIRLKTELERKAVMTQTSVDPIPAGFHTITPYIVADDAVQLIDFVKATFGAVELGRAIGSAGGLHCTVRIGESMLMIGGGGGGTAWKGGRTKPAAIHIFVDDADEVFERAVQAGATSLMEPRDLPYGERSGAVKDASDTEWYIATPLQNWHGEGVEGLRTFALCLHPKGASEFIEFLTQAFDAVEVQRHDSPEGVVLHAKVRIGDTVIEMGEAHDQWQHKASMIHMYVPNVDAMYERAMRAGGTSLMPPADQPYGDRMAGIRDAFGYEWYMACRIRA